MKATCPRRRDLAVASALLSMACSCTSIEVEPLPQGVSEVAIVRNDKVLVEDFVPVMRAALGALDWKGCKVSTSGVERARGPAPPRFRCARHDECLKRACATTDGFQLHRSRFGKP